MSEDFEREPDFIERGVMLFEQRRYDLAQREFEQALLDNPGNGRAHAYLSMCFLEQGQLKKASEVAQSAIEADPEGHWGYYAQARAFRRRHREKEAHRAIHKALELRPESPGYLGFCALLAVDRKDWDEAIRCAEEGLAFDAEDSQCHNLRALALIRKGQIMPAREALLELLQRDSSNPMTLANLGWLALRQGQRQEALDHFSASLAEDPESEYARDGLLEALRSQYPLYGMVLRHMLWMSNLSGKAQWGVMIFTYYLRRGLRELGRRYPRLEPLVNFILYCLSLFTYMTWIARPVTSLLLRLNAYGRRILNQDEVDESNLVGIELVTGLASWGLWHFTGRTPWLVVMLVMLTLVMPSCTIYNCEKGWPRQVMQIYTAVLAGIGLFSAWSLWQNPLWGPWRSLLPAYGIGLFASQYIGNLLASVRVRK